MTDWDSRYQSGDTPWCKGRPHPLLATLAREVFPAEFPGRILVPGCGRGWDLAGLADALPAAEIIGIDLSERALADVPQAIRANPRIRLLAGDFLDASWLKKSVGSASVLWEHTCFCAIDPGRRADYVASAGAILQPGAMLLGLFFLHLDSSDGGPPWNCPPDELSRHFAPTFQIERCDAAHVTFPGRVGEESAVVMRKRP